MVRVSKSSSCFLISSPALSSTCPSKCYSSSWSVLFSLPKIVQFNGMEYIHNVSTTLALASSSRNSSSSPETPDLFSPTPWPLATTNLLSISMGLSILDIPWKWNLTTCGPLCLASFTQHDGFATHPWCCVAAPHSFLWLNNVPSYGQTIICLPTLLLTDIWVVSTFYQ